MRKLHFFILAIVQCFFYGVFLFFPFSTVMALNITIEGMPGAGKTTSLIELIGELPEGFILLSETNPEPNAKWQEEEIKDQTQIYHQIWVKRMACVSQLSEKNESVFLFDRSYFSNLAFKYAFDFLLKSSDFSSYLNLYKKDLEKQGFSLIIVLDVSPTIGTYRRLRLENPIPYPWSEKQFLFGMRKFYLEELPKITSSKIIYINTDFLSPSDVKLKILETLKLHVPFGERKEALSHCHEGDLLIEYGRLHSLGEIHSPIINVFDCPTIYFLKHSLQLVKGQPVFFNNTRLEEIVEEL